jgi:hypothetical protein
MCSAIPIIDIFFFMLFTELKAKRCPIRSTPWVFKLDEGFWSNLFCAWPNTICIGKIIYYLEM